MAYRNKYDSTGKCSEEGANAEATFVALATKRGYSPRKTSKQDDMRKHVDYVLKAKGKSGKPVELGVDVKAMKRIQRRVVKGGELAKVQDEWHWIELKNVQGKHGWVYGEAHFIAFERENDFILVNRQELVDWLGSSKKIRYDLPFVTLAKLAKYKIYQRKGRRDEITQIRTEDLLSLKSAKIWKKYSEVSDVEPIG